MSLGDKVYLKGGRDYSSHWTERPVVPSLGLQPYVNPILPERGL